MNQRSEIMVRVLWFVLFLTAFTWLVQCAYSQENEPPSPNTPMPYSVVQRYWAEVLAVRAVNRTLEERNQALEAENHTLRTKVEAGEGGSPSLDTERILAAVESLRQPPVHYQQVTWRYINPTLMEGAGDDPGDSHYIQRFRQGDQSLWDNVAHNEFVELPSTFTPPGPIITEATQLHSMGRMVRLRWLDRAPNEDGFRIYRADESYGPWLRILEVGEGVTEIELAAETGSQAYTVRAFNENGESAFSNAKILTVVDSPPPRPPPLDAVKTLRVDAVSASHDTLADGGPGADGKPDVFIISTGSEAGNPIAGYNRVGDWMEWTFATATGQVWTGEIRMANPTVGGETRVDLNGELLGAFVVPKTAGWDQFGAIPFAKRIEAGMHTLRLTATKAGENGWTGDVAGIILSPTLGPGPTP